MAAVAAEEKALVPVNSKFIERTLVGPGFLNLLKGVAWGNVFALSQAVGTAWMAESKAAKSQGKALDIPAFKAQTWARTKAFWPAVVGTTAAFTMIRGNGDTTGFSGMVKPLAIVAVPTIGFAAYYRAAPPHAMSLGLLSCVLLHGFDRVLKPRGLFEENMPTAKLHRRTL